ncbi:MAG: hypothetical protein IKY90_08895 [Oscillospiraceae bacterium]|nr:hypothetical protein [Oscillospiraceae bacterium]
MDKFIEAEKLKQVVKANDWSNKAVPLAVGMIIDAMPSADVVQVVRCKYCRYWDECRIGEGLCEHPVNGITRDYTLGDDFCSYGERKPD